MDPESIAAADIELVRQRLSGIDEDPVRKAALVDGVHELTTRLSELKALAARPGAGTNDRPAW